ncbi:MAG: cell wall-binding repeat-containing protein [Catenulispora sp.]
MRAQRLSALAVGALTALAAVPTATASAWSAAVGPTAATAGPAEPAEPATELIVEGQPGDLVTNGFTGVEQGAAYRMEASALADARNVNPPTPSITFDTIHNGSTNDPSSFSFAFAMPSAQPWAVGQTYVNTEGFVGYTGGNLQPLTYNGTQPWLYLSQWRTGFCGSNGDLMTPVDIKGTFKIDDLTWTNGVDSRVARMQVEFTESCRGRPTVRGLFRLNESGPLPPGAPTGRPLPAGQGTVAPLAFRRGTSIIAAPAGAVDGPRLATVSSESEGRTAYNPLGTRLLYSSDPGLSTVLPDGSHAARLTESAGSSAVDTEPAVSPDGSSVVFVQNGAAGGPHLVSENTDGTSVDAAHRMPLGVACQAEHRPSFAPDGSLIFECDNGGAPATYRLAGGAAQQVLPNASQAVYSPDGGKIAFVRPDAGGVPQIFTAHADGGGVTQVSQEHNPAGKPAWSPDGRYLAYVNSAFREIVEIPAAGGAPVGSIPDADDPDFTPPVVDSHVIREWGTDRIATAIAASQLNFADHGGSGDYRRAPAGAVVLARSDTFADALGGSALAARKGAPLLITGTDGLEPAVKKEIGRVLAPGGTVYLLGGTAALSPAVQSALSGYTVVRLGGENRYDTAVKIAKQVTSNPHTVMVASGDNFPDALAAGATGEPVLLTSGSAMPKETAAYLNTLNPDMSAAGGTDVVTVGGPGDAALYAAHIGGEMPSWPATVTRTKLAGADRYSTALLVAKSFFTGDTDAALATGSTWPDALSGGAMVGHRGGPLLLTDPSGISPAVLDYLRTQSASLLALHLLGGPAALPNAIAQQGAGVIGIPGHVRIDSFTLGGVYPYDAKAANAGADDRAARSSHASAMSRTP